jgi:hypothetical protein
MTSREIRTRSSTATSCVDAGAANMAAAMVCLIAPLARCWFHASYSGSQGPAFVLIPQNQNRTIVGLAAER